MRGTFGARHLNTNVDDTRPAAPLGPDALSDVGDCVVFTRVGTGAYCDVCGVFEKPMHCLMNKHGFRCAEHCEVHNPPVIDEVPAA